MSDDTIGEIRKALTVIGAPKSLMDILCSQDGHSEVLQRLKKWNERNLNAVCFDPLTFVDIESMRN